METINNIKSYFGGKSVVFKDKNLRVDKVTVINTFKEGANRYRVPCFKNGNIEILTLNDEQANELELLSTTNNSVLMYSYRSHRSWKIGGFLSTSNPIAIEDLCNLKYSRLKNFHEVKEAMIHEEVQRFNNLVILALDHIKKHGYTASLHILEKCSPLMLTAILERLADFSMQVGQVLGIAKQNEQYAN